MDVRLKVYSQQVKTCIFYYVYEKWLHEAQIS